MIYYKLTDKLNKDVIVKDDDGKRYTYCFGNNEWVRSGIMVRYMWPEDSRYDEYVTISEEEAYQILNKQGKYLDSMLPISVKMAEDTFTGCYDIDGNSYFTHISKIAGSIESTEKKIVAYLYSVCNKKKLTSYDVEKMGFTFRIANSVSILIEENDMTYEKYLRMVKKDSNASAVKKAYINYYLDMYHNGNLSEVNYEQIEKYEKTLMCLER